jgi:hypothetical protein
MALLKDWAKGKHQIEIGIFRQVVELGYHNAILETNEHEFTANFLINELKRYYSKETSYSIIALLFGVLRNYLISQPAVRPVGGNVPPRNVPSGKKRTKISFEAKKQAYSYAKLVQNGNLHMTQAVNELVENHGWNSAASAQMYLNGIKCLFNGMEYSRDMSHDAIKYYFEQILHDYGEGGLKKALEALRLRINWLNDNNFTSHAAGLEAIQYDVWTIGNAI